MQKVGNARITKYTRITLIAVTIIILIVLASIPGSCYTSNIAEITNCNILPCKNTAQTSLISGKNISTAGLGSGGFILLTVGRYGIYKYTYYKSNQPVEYIHRFHLGYEYRGSTKSTGHPYEFSSPDLEPNQKLRELVEKSLEEDNLAWLQLNKNCGPLKIIDVESYPVYNDQIPMQLTLSEIAVIAGIVLIIVCVCIFLWDHYL